MKKLSAVLLLIALVLALLSPAEAIAKKKKKVLKRRRHYRRIVRNWPKGGPRPVFPKAGDEPAAVVEPPPAPVPPAVAAKPADPPARSFFWAEGGLAGGGFAAELGYGRSLNEKLSLRGAAGYIFGVSNGAFLLDPVRLTCDLGAYMVGVGGNCAFYTDKTQLGLEVFAAKQLNRVTGRIGYSSALGLRAGVGCEF